jgi:hypothetical protein
MSSPIRVKPNPIYRWRHETKNQQVSHYLDSAKFPGPVVANFILYLAIPTYKDRNPFWDLNQPALAGYRIRR